MHEILPGLSQSLGVVGCCATSLDALQMIWVYFDSSIGVLKGLFIFFQFDVALGPIAEDDGSQQMV